MKPTLLKTILLIGVVSMFCFCGCQPIIQYEKYSSKDPQLNITMDYISDWRYVESRGSYNSYTQVQFIEPAKSDKKLLASITVTTKTTSQAGLASPTIEAMADDIKTKKLKLKDAQLLARGKINLLNTEGICMDFSYKQLDNLRTIDAKLIPSKERTIILKQGDKFYIIRYVNTEEEFNKYSAAFKHVIKSLQSK